MSANDRLTETMRLYSDAMDARHAATQAAFDALDKAFEDAIAKCMPATVKDGAG